ncbi:MAG: hypothetical protein VB957_19795 [Pseudomonadales bacterium]
MAKIGEMLFDNDHLEKVPEDGQPAHWHWIIETGVVKRGADIILTSRYNETIA